MGSINHGQLLWSDQDSFVVIIFLILFKLDRLHLQLQQILITWDLFIIIINHINLHHRVSLINLHNYRLLNFIRNML